MTVRRSAATLVLAFVALGSYTVRADVRADQKTRVEFGGMFGRMVNTFGGKSAREGAASTVAVKDNRKATVNENTGQIVDLAEEKIYDLVMKKKTYKVTTFAELRRRMEAAEQRAAEQADKESGEPSNAEPARDGKQMEVDFDVKRTGEKKTINGFDTHQAIATVSVREKGRTLEQGGGMVMTTDMWLAPKIRQMDEIAAFDQRYFEKLYGPVMAGVSAEDTAALIAMYPMMKQAMARMRAEGGKLDGTPILTTLTFEAVRSAEQMAAQQSADDNEGKASSSGGIGGLVGGFARRAAAKKLQGAPRPRTMVMTGTTEVLSVVTDVTSADVGIPAGFKEVR